MKEKNKIVCVQCFKDLSNYEIGHDIYDDLIKLPVCENPACPNYGLFQVGTKE